MPDSQTGRVVLCAQDPEGCREGAPGLRRGDNGKDPCVPDPSTVIVPVVTPHLPPALDLSPPKCDSSPSSISTVESVD